MAQAEVWDRTPPSSQAPRDDDALNHADFLVDLIETHTECLAFPVVYEYNECVSQGLPSPAATQRISYWYLKRRVPDIFAMETAPLYPYMPPSRQSWETLTFFWQLAPIVSLERPYL